MEELRLCSNRRQRLLSTSSPSLLTHSSSITSTDALTLIETNNNTNVNLNSGYTSSQISAHNVYQMQSRPRGFCIIINNVDFDEDKHPKRIGSDEECLRLSEIFSRLYFDIRVQRNIGRTALLEYLRSMAKHSDLKRHDCLVLIILSHGNSGQLITSDNNGLEFETILTIFNNQNCHHLIKKPKMFFFNCCRGSTLDFGPQFGSVEPHEGLDVADATLFPCVATISDMMICFSTIDGYVSWRNEHQGTWFGAALAQTLQNYAHTSELNQILTIAADIVHNRTTRNGAKQAIEWKYRAWTKSLFFNPGYTEQSK